MQNVNVRFPNEIHSALTAYKQNEKPHMSLNAIIVEAVAEQVARHEREQRIRSGKSQLDVSALAGEVERRR